MDLMKAMDVQQPFRSQKEQYGQWLKQLLRRCPDRDDAVDVTWHWLLCEWMMDDEEAIRDVFDKQQQARTVPLLVYLSFCNAASFQLAFKNPALSEQLAQAVLAEADAPAVSKAATYLRLEQCAGVCRTRRGGPSTGPSRSPVYAGSPGVRRQDNPGEFDRLRYAMRQVRTG